MITFERTNSEDARFLALVAELDRELAIRDGHEHSFYAKYNTLQQINHVVVAFNGPDYVACGAMKEAAQETVELKRMYTRETFRRKGIAALVVNELEQWAMELGYSSCILETGKRQPEAIALYLKCGYHVIENFGQYKGVENSVCFQKNL